MLCFCVLPSPPHADSSTSERVFVALGGNLGDVATAFDGALDRLAARDGVRLVSRSPTYRTKPIGVESQPDFLNAVAEFRVSLAPATFLDLLHAAERAAGREREAEVRWGPRPLDLDLILWGSRMVAEPGLTIPHPRFAERLFVLDPLADIAPSVVPPGHSLTVEQLRDALRGVRG